MRSGINQKAIALSRFGRGIGTLHDSMWAAFVAQKLAKPAEQGLRLGSLTDDLSHHRCIKSTRLYPVFRTNLWL